MTKVLLIDAAARTVTEVDVASTYDAIKGHIQNVFCIGATFDAEDVLFVDDEGLLKNMDHYFCVPENSQPLAGNGVVTGPDGFNDDGEEISLDVRTTAADMAAKITWMTRLEFLEWAKPRAGQPTMSITSIKDGRPHTEVLATLGDMIAEQHP